MHEIHDPAEICRQSISLAEHFQRLGIRWLPIASEEKVSQLAAQMHLVESNANAPNAADTPVESFTEKHRTTDRNARVDSASLASASPLGSEFNLVGNSPDSGQSYLGPALSQTQRTEALTEYAQKVEACTRCEILSKCRTKTVFGEGNVTPRVVFFGEGPGRDEDLSGRPFVGKAGQLLTKMIQACSFAREEVYIMNTVKCRPPNNRNPEPTEVENCRQFFEAQLQILRPEYIVCLGLVSAQALLKTKLSVGKMRGKFHKHFDSKVLVTYHPSYLLRTPAAKKAAWDDLQIMLRDAGLM